MLTPKCFDLYSTFKLAIIHYVHFYNITNLMTCNTPGRNQTSKDFFFPLAILL